MTSTLSGPVLRYPGAKWRSSGWILPHFPEHYTYVEPFFGSGAVFFNKKASKSEYLNDLDSNIVHLFKILRERGAELAELITLTPYSRDEYALALEPSEDPLERARRLMVRYWMSMGGKGGNKGSTGWRHGGPEWGKAGVPTVWANLPERVLKAMLRLKGAHIENLPAQTLLERLDGPDVLFYLDPPYLGSVRGPGNLYAEEMRGAGQHLELLSQICTLRGMVVLSGYASELYDLELSHWMRVSKCVPIEMGQSREEVLWINPAAARRFERFQDGLWGGRA